MLDVVSQVQAQQAQPQPVTRPADAAPPGAASAAGATRVETPEAVAPVAETPSIAEPDLTEAEQRQVEELRARDREVRAHEQAHKSVAGPYAGAISYEYQTGPDGVRYAVGGSVPIDTSAEDDPEATVAKMDVVIRAALAPAEPSSADRAIAAQARATRAEASAELQAQRAAERGYGLTQAPAEDAGAASGLLI